MKTVVERQNEAIPVEFLIHITHIKYTYKVLGEYKLVNVSHSVVFDSLQPHGL